MIPHFRRCFCFPALLSLSSSSLSSSTSSSTTADTTLLTISPFCASHLAVCSLRPFYANHDLFILPRPSGLPARYTICSLLVRLHYLFSHTSCELSFFSRRSDSRVFFGRAPIDNVEDDRQTRVDNPLSGNFVSVPSVTRPAVGFARPYAFFVFSN